MKKKKKILGEFTLLAWVAFFLSIGQTWSFPWNFILATVGSVALVWTVELWAGQGKSKEAHLLTGSPWTLSSVVLWIVFLGWITPHLSSYWSLLVPLLAIIAARGVYRLWPDPKHEEKPEDLLAAEDSHRAE